MDARRRGSLPEEAAKVAGAATWPRSSTSSSHPTVPCRRPAPEAPRSCGASGVCSWRRLLIRLATRWKGAERPYDVRPQRLYTRDDLMRGWRPGGDHSTTLDGRIYAYVEAHGGRAPDIEEGLAQRTHEHFIDVALASFRMHAGRPVVGVMGGSSTVAADPDCRRVVHLAASLTERGYLVVGGGGLEVMRPRTSAHTWRLARGRSATTPWTSWRARHHGRESRPATCASRMGSAGASRRAGRAWCGDPDVGERWRADQPARLAHREVLLEQHPRGRDARRRDRRHRVRARGAGTMQEIFQDAAHNAYRICGRSPMAFLDTQHYCAATGLYPALQRQAERLGFADLLS